MNSTVRPYKLIPPPLANALKLRIPAALAGVILSAAYLAIWLVRRTYSGLDDDAHLYALQALARLKPEFNLDLFLAYGSQDKYTFFTHCYAWVIDKFGLTTAESLLTLLFHAWSATAAWFIARRFTTDAFAWLTVGMVLVVPGMYGARGVFEYAETFLTARLPAEALVLTSLALLLHARRWLAGLFALLSLMAHPIVTAPGLVVLVLLASAPRWRIWLIVAGATACVVVVATAYLGFIPGLHFMDAEWLGVVRARSFFMFVETWQAEDWNWLLLTLITLVFAAIANNGEALKDTAIAAAVTGAAGLILAALTSVAPVEFLIKGQAWRWTWISTYVAVLTFVPTWVACWTRDSVARFACLLLYSSWIFPLTWSTSNMLAALLAGLALVVYYLRHRIAPIHMRYFKWLTIGVATIAAISVLLTANSMLQLDFTTNREERAVERARDLAGLTVPALAIILLAWLTTIRLRFVASALPMSASVIAVLAGLLPSTHKAWTSSPYESAYASFAPWRAAVDHRRSVFWFANPVGVWLLLDSPSYLSTSQSAGVVFSRETALEVRRRAAVLAPLAGHSDLAIGIRHQTKSDPLTLHTLLQVCSDPQLGYLVSADELELPHLESPKGRWGHLHLYSCDDLPRSAS